MNERTLIQNRAETTFVKKQMAADVGRRRGGINVRCALHLPSPMAQIVQFLMA